MNIRIFSGIGLSLTLFLAACDDGSVVRRPGNQSDASGAALSGVREQLNQEPVSVEVGEIIDPAAKFINPFKPSYSYKERIVYDRLLERAREDAGYLDRSLQATQDSFSEIAIDIPGEPYEEVLRRAAIVHASAMLGDRMAHEAKVQIVDILDTGIVLKDKKELDELLTRAEYADRLAEFRKRNYLNYFLSLDDVLANGTRETIREEAERLVGDQT
jgi:hypothetical protein